MKATDLLIIAGLGIGGYLLFRQRKAEAAEKVAEEIGIDAEKMIPGQLYTRTEAINKDLISSDLISTRIDGIIMCPNCKSIIGLIEPEAGKVYAQVMTDLNCPVCGYGMLRVRSTGYKLVPIFPTR